MAVETLRVGGTFPVGTSVSAYAVNSFDNLPSSGTRGLGAADATAQVASGSTLTFANLDYDQRYVAHASVDGTDKYLRFATETVEPVEIVGSAGVTYAASFGVSPEASPTTNDSAVAAAADDAADYANETGAPHGVVHLPPGVLDFSATVPLRAGENDTWVVYHGAGQDVTMLRWQDDLGDGQFAMDGGTDPAPGRYLLRDFTVRGPGDGQPLGESPADMDGIRLPYGSKAMNLSVGGFHAAVTFLNDHNTLENCKLNLSYYAVYYLAPAGARGNNTIKQCKLDGNCKASIGIGPAGGMEGDLLQQVHFGFGPYGIWAEAGAYSVSLTSQFDSCAWESCGNAAIASADDAPRFDANVLINCFALGLDTNYNIVGESTDWMFRGLSTFNGNRVIGGTVGSGRGDIGWLDAGGADDNEVEGAVPSGEGYKQMSDDTAWSGRPTNVFRPGSGVVAYMHKASGAIAANTVVCYGPNAYTGNVSTNPTSNESTVAGVAHHAAADGEWVLIAKSGPHDVKASEDGSGSQGPVAVSAATAGYVKNASGSDRVIGTFYNSFGSAPRVFVVQLQGLA